jgi:hypothetical protein
MLSFDERISNVEALIVQTYNDYIQLATDDEISAVTTQIFSEGIEILESRIEAIKNNLDIVERIISKATG